jgi:predicted dehydrogenase
MPRTVNLSPAPRIASNVVAAFIGAGNYAGRVLIPAFKAAGAQLHAVVSAGGVSAAHLGGKHGFAAASTDAAAVLADPAVTVAVIATRHNDHAPQVLAALRAGKHVFCEKPLCLTLDELAQIEDAAGASLLMVGFNRRFAPHVVTMKAMLATTPGPKAFVMTVNAGAVPSDHWTQDQKVGGGRIVGEACHFIDLLRHLAGAAIVRHSTARLGLAGATADADSATIFLEFADGSAGTIHYLANGERGFPKERLEVFAAGRILQLDNFRNLRAWGWPGFSGKRLWRQDKGQAACVKAFVEAVRGSGASPIALEEILEVSRISIEAQQSVF